MWPGGLSQAREHTWTLGANSIRGGGGGQAPHPWCLRAHFLPAAAKIAGLYNDSEPPRKTMRRGVLMTLLQQSAMTLPLWIGKPGDK